MEKLKIISILKLLFDHFLHQVTRPTRQIGAGFQFEWMSQMSSKSKIRTTNESPLISLDR